jgi:hypothetical protein
MPDKSTMNDPQNVWQNQPTEAFKMSAAELHLKAQKFEKRVSWRNLREYAAGAILIPLLGFGIWLYPSILMRTGHVLLIAGTLFVLWALHKRGAARTVPPGLEFCSSLEFHRKELQRQRDLLRGIWWWYLFPLVPGMFVLKLGFLEQELKGPNASAHVGAIVIRFGVDIVITVLFFVGIGWLNHRAANKLQLRIDALDALEKES